MTQPLYIVLHVYKTAGMNLMKNFEMNFRGDAWLPIYRKALGQPRSGIFNAGWDLPRIQQYVAEHASPGTRCICGHMAYYGIHELMPAGQTFEPRYIIFLRDPVDRCVSIYSYIKGGGTSRWAEEIRDNDWSLAEWYRRSEMLEKSNGQVRYLLQGSYPEVMTQQELTREHLEEAKRRLRQFWFVGLTSCFDADAHYLYGKLGFWRFLPAAVINASRRDKQIPEETRQMIAEGNALDLELFAYAQELHEAFVRQAGDDYQAAQSLARRKRLLYQVFANTPVRVFYNLPRKAWRALTTAQPKPATGGTATGGTGGAVA